MNINFLIEQVKKNLLVKGYSIQENIQYGGFKYFPENVLMVGHLYKSELTKGQSDYFFIVGYLKDASVANIKAFSSQSFTYAASNQSEIPSGLSAE